MPTKHKKLPSELKSLVGESVALLGEVIKEEGGKELYQCVEKIRLLMVNYRDETSLEKREATLMKLYDLLEKQKKEGRHQVAHSYSMMLELINSCEAAYRTFRLKTKERPVDFTRQDNTIVYVLTAHPTEARTSQNIEIFHRVQAVLLRILEHSGEKSYLQSIIKHNLKLAWLLPITRHEKPQVEDEANHLFSIILRPDILDTILRTDRDLGDFRVRTWVGGDKDGHPGVNEKVMLNCLNASRKHFILATKRILGELKKDLDYLQEKKLADLYAPLIQTLKLLSKVQSDDSKNLKVFREDLKKLDLAYRKCVGQDAPRIKKLWRLLKLFPALVIPIEMREDSEIIQQGLSASSPIAIQRMLIKLNEISAGGNPNDYAQGFVISMCESYNDIVNAVKMVKECLGGLPIPIIPLFETAKALNDSTEIVTKLLQNKSFVANLKRKWSGHLEIMLGYSDSSKGMGVLPSRLGIAKTIRSLDALISKHKLTPIFFHGSGGSVDRGGGSLEEQTAWWPKSALSFYKATIQGEMVERNFNSPQVSLSGIQKIMKNFDRSKAKKGAIKVPKILEEFSYRVEASYKNKIGEESFFQMIEAATPYSYLSALKLGSRPSKRAKATKLDLSSIRAIPWILCWTQTRVLFPTWWGVGSAWKELSSFDSKVEELKTAYEESNLFASYIRVLGFTLSKVDMGVFKLYLEKSSLSAEAKKNIFDEFSEELKWTRKFLYGVTGQKDLLWYRRWLAESIELRSSMIHPLNMLQILAYRENDLALVRKTVAGISSGMMTTG